MSISKYANDILKVSFELLFWLFILFEIVFCLEKVNILCRIIQQTSDIPFEFRLVSGNIKKYILDGSKLIERILSKTISSKL